MTSAIISGGGIAGLGSALALARSGWQVTILERAQSFREFGAGLQISPNAFHILEQWGLTAPLLERGVEPDGVEIRTADKGTRLAKVPINLSRQRYGAPYLAVLRADLHRILLDAAREMPNITVLTDKTVTDTSLSDDCITTLATSDDGEITSHEADLLIAADGVWSSLRQTWFQFPKAAYSGITAWRACIPMELVPDGLSRHNTTAWVSPVGHMVHYPVDAGRHMNIIVNIPDNWQEETWSAPANGTALIDHLHRWSSLPLSLLNVVPEWTKWALCAPEPTGKAVAQRAVLVGDAAHATLPFMAQGAAMAIEDAEVLARCLSGPAFEEKGLQAALEVFEAKRAKRVIALVKEARKNQRIYHLSGPLAAARNLVLKATSENRLLARYDWIYGWHPDNN